MCILLRRLSNASGSYQSRALYSSIETAHSSTSWRPSATPRIVRETGVVGKIPIPCSREPSCFSTRIPLQVRRYPPGTLNGLFRAIRHRVPGRAYNLSGPAAALISRVNAPDHSSGTLEAGVTALGLGHDRLQSEITSGEGRGDGTARLGAAHEGLFAVRFVPRCSGAIHQRSNPAQSPRASGRTFWRRFLTPFRLRA